MKDVEEKLDKMKRKISTDMKKLMILYFLCNVVKANVKAGGPIDPFILRIVDDLNACETFPWGSYTFNDFMEGVSGMMKKMNGFVKRGAQFLFPGFIVPLEIQTFECIPRLGRKFRQDVPADKKCPRMCKHKLTKYCMIGFLLDAINETLGSTKDISSIFEPDSGENAMLACIIDNDVNDGICYIDPVVDSWRESV